MVDYTWVANLLREIEAFAAVNKVTSLSESLTIACVALLSDTEGKAEISADARIWLHEVATRQLAPSCISGENFDGVHSGLLRPASHRRWADFYPTLVQ